jgi:hypothetical protein
MAKHAAVARIVLPSMAGGGIPSARGTANTMK